MLICAIEILNVIIIIIIIIIIIKRLAKGGGHGHPRTPLATPLAVKRDDSKGPH